MDMRATQIMLDSMAFAEKEYPDEKKSISIEDVLSDEDKKELDDAHKIAQEKEEKKR